MKKLLGFLNTFFILLKTQIWGRLWVTHELPIYLNHLYKNLYIGSSLVYIN